MSDHPQGMHVTSETLLERAMDDVEEARERGTVLDLKLAIVCTVGEWVEEESKSVPEGYNMVARVTDLARQRCLLLEEANG
jgi:hypothetical protein